jgi:hypothetical protein
MGKLVAILGQEGDGTPFNNSVSAQAIADLLHEWGYQAHGKCFLLRFSPSVFFSPSFFCLLIFD